MYMWGNNYGGYRGRRTTNNDIKDAIAFDISNRYRRIDFRGLSFEKIDVMPEKAWKHTCVGVGISEQNPIRIFVGEGIPVLYIYCNQCYKVIYYVEQVY